MKHLAIAAIAAIALVVAGLVLLQAQRDALPGVAAGREREAAARAALAEAQAAIDAREYDAREQATTVAATIALVGLGLGLAVAAVAGAIGVSRWLHLRARLVMPHGDTALYPAVMIDGMPATFNQNGAQLVAAMAVGGRRPTAAMLETIMQPQELPPPVEPQPMVIEAITAELPTVVPVYRAEVPSQPALMVGVGATGPVSLPLHNLGNVLIGGMPGAGKTEAIASMLAGLMRYDATGATVRLAVADPKMIDFGAIPSNLAALMWPVAKTVEDAARLIAACRAEGERRFATLDAAGARNLAQYNAAHEPLPYLVVAVDELADLTGDGTFVDHALAIGRKGRAAGVTLVLATQRPSADIVPSSLRAVCGAQIAFRVLNSRDSATILGVGGAENLPNVPGRCIVRRSDLQTVQAYHADLDRRFYPFVGRLPRGDVRLLPPPVATGDDVPIEADFAAINRWQPVDVDATQVERIPRGRRPTAAQAATMRAMWHAGWSANRLSQRFWGYKDSDTLRILREVLH